MQEVVAHQPAIAYAVGCLPLYDKLELTLELLNQDGWPEFDTRGAAAAECCAFPPARSGSSALLIALTCNGALGAEVQLSTGGHAAFSKIPLVRPHLAPGIV